MYVESKRTISLTVEKDKYYIDSYCSISWRRLKPHFLINWVLVFQQVLTKRDSAPQKRYSNVSSPYSVSEQLEFNWIQKQSLVTDDVDILVFHLQVILTPVTVTARYRVLRLPIVSRPPWHTPRQITCGTQYFLCLTCPRMTPTKSPSTKTTSGNRDKCARKQLTMGGLGREGGGKLPSQHYGGARWKFRKEHRSR